MQGLTQMRMARMQGLTLRRADAQRALAVLLSAPGAVLVGHALHHDLHALRLDFQPVIDTSLICTYKCAQAVVPQCLIILQHRLIDTLLSCT